MSTTIVDINGADLRTSPIFMRDCHFPITDWVKRCPPDEVVANIPTLIGSWEDGTIAPAITGYTDEIDHTVNAGDDCRLPVVSTMVDACDLIAPNQQELGAESPQLNWSQLKTDFCKSRNILPGQLCVFNSDGTLNMGDPYVIDFIRFSLEAISRVLGKLITRSSLIGDEANPAEFDGMYTQIDNGWDAGATPCGAEFNVGQVIDWNALTGGTGCASPSDTTIAGQTVNIWGVDCDIPEGMNLAELLEDLWIEKVSLEWADAFGGVDMWEMHTGYGQAKCMINAAACMQPCSISGEFDPTLRERFQRLRTNNLVELYPSGITFPVFQTRYVGDNQIRFGPRSIGGRPTYGLFFDNIERYLDMFPAGGLYGNGRGFLGDGEDFLTPITQDFIDFDFENQTIYWDIFKETAKCVIASMLTHVGMLVCSRHLWLRVDNVCCESCVTVCDERLTITT